MFATIICDADVSVQMMKSGFYPLAVKDLFLEMQASVNLILPKSLP